MVHSNNKISLEAARLRKYKSIKVPDAIMAATSKVLSLPLIAADKVFSGIAGLDVIEYQPRL
ncbi:MAG: hypothetical protein J0L66_12800 [Cytophagales bacterium]|nr:hypothetical protein [Cytophagales bacterium]